MSEKYNKLKSQLMTLFQLDQPELDFGIYRIMHMKKDDVVSFLDADLPPQVSAAFEQYQSADKVELKKQLAEQIANATALGIEPGLAPKVVELREILAHSSVDIESLEGDVYDHLSRFFSRYYSEGDFISKRVYKNGVYALPYQGEEVKLSWANEDQYYIKSSETLRNYSFRLNPHEDSNPMRVNFEISDAIEGEHSNVKESEDAKRVFILAVDEYLVAAAGELYIRFEYRPASKNDWPADEREGKKAGPKQTDLIRIAVERVRTDSSEDLTSWVSALLELAPTAADKSRTVLAKNIERFSKRNTFDYFIHKDLGKFLRQELDFYIKNEVMHLDDIENDTVPRVEQYLSMIKVIRKIAGKIIDLLAQIENFQKKLWLKKKFVIETNYIITLSEVPDEFFPEIATNEAQLKEWKTYYSIEGLQQELFSTYPTLPIDTCHFSSDFKNRLIAALSAKTDLEDALDGLLVHSENFQGLSLLESRYSDQIQCIYIDPPYNTGKDGFPYKDSYQHSSWLTAVTERARLSAGLLDTHGVFFSSIADHEVDSYRLALHNVFGRDNFLANMIWNNEGNIDNQSKVKTNHEYVLTYCKNESNFAPPRVIAPEIGESSKLFNDTIENSITKNGPKNPASTIVLPQGFPTSSESGTISARTDTWPHLLDEVSFRNHELTSSVRAFSGWSSRGLLEAFIANGCDPIVDAQGQTTWFKLTGTGAIYVYKTRADESHALSIIRNVGTVKKTASMLKGMGLSFQYPKPVELVSYLARFPAEQDREVILDYFAGSGTTAHAVMNLNRADGLRRKFVLIEMAAYFDELIVPRVKKIIFAPSWKGGTPQRFASQEEIVRSARLVKYVRLESYEDTLNNLTVVKNKEATALLSMEEANGENGLKEQYLLRYMLNAESKGSKSLVDITAFVDPDKYELDVKKAGSDESARVAIDLVETFNWLLGLRVSATSAPSRLASKTTRDGEGRLVLDGRLREDSDGEHWFRTVNGTTPSGQRVLVIWRNLPGVGTAEGIEIDNLILNEWFKKQRLSAADDEFDLVYVNGNNTLGNLGSQDKGWKVRATEEEFMRLMFDETGR